MFRKYRVRCHTDDMDDHSHVSLEAIESGRLKDALRSVEPERIGLVMELAHDASYVEPRVVTQRV